LHVSGSCQFSPLRLTYFTIGMLMMRGSLILYVYYAEEEADAEIHGRRASLSGPDRTFRRARRAWIVLIVVCSFAFTILLVSTVISRRFPWVAQTWANILGIGVALLACVQWLPQVLTSWHLGSLGSLSLVALSISAPVRAPPTPRKTSLAEIRKLLWCKADRSSILGYLASA
jgi:hypothetical protein